MIDSSIFDSYLIHLSSLFEVKYKEFISNAVSSVFGILTLDTTTLRLDHFLQLVIVIALGVCIIGTPILMDNRGVVVLQDLSYIAVSRIFSIFYTFVGLKRNGISSGLTCHPT